MKKTTLLATLTAAGLAFAVAACDQQQADSSGDSSTAPLQQQGAVPAEPATEGVETNTAPADAAPSDSMETMPQSDVPAPSSDTTQ
ncbi:hypothetical protein HBA54_11360 [Pelagibius litoralis]|uniref:Uncharacterized protein n=1 Tax=Pelagibius litoralis TaxID=374515 RepID=A0A967EXF5_9PROT|nr:hypothetical protein [Pelagibius litoralis]NIA69187.1 hypothetical protein [Pelagibius litoralis]